MTTQQPPPPTIIQSFIIRLQIHSLSGEPNNNKDMANFHWLIVRHRYKMFSLAAMLSCQRLLELFHNLCNENEHFLPRSQQKAEKCHFNIRTGLALAFIPSYRKSTGILSARFINFPSNKRLLRSKYGLAPSGQNNTIKDQIDCSFTCHSFYFLIVLSYISLLFVYVTSNHM